MRRAFAVFGIAGGLAIGTSPASLAQYLTGSVRENFVKSTAAGCIRAKATANDPDANLIPNSLYEGYCRCYASVLADKLKVSDIESDNRTVTDPIVKAAGTSCYHAMKAEALRLYNAGQYPKR